MPSYVEINYSIENKGSHTRNASLSSAVSISVPVGANVLWIAAETQNVRLTLDGTTPTSTIGMPLYAGQAGERVPVAYGMTVKIIEAASGGVVNYQFQKV